MAMTNWISTMFVTILDGMNDFIEEIQENKKIKNLRIWATIYIQILGHLELE